MSVELTGKNLENTVNSWIQYKKWEWKFSALILGLSGIAVLYFLGWLSKMFNY